MLATVWPGRLAAACRALLGAEVACAADRCWVRRQYPLDRYPLGHAAHAWHQDGALAFDFLAEAGATPAADALLEMMTCWIALTPCGDDAPALELFATPAPALLSLAALAEAARRGAAAPARLLRPVLAAGDAIAFGGGVVHHTHVTPRMRRDRTSIELRFFAARRLPARLAGDRFIRIDC